MADPPHNQEKKSMGSSPLVLICAGALGLVFLAGVTLGALYFNGVIGSNSRANGVPPEGPGNMPFDAKGGGGPGGPFDPAAKGLPFDPKQGPPGLRVDWQVRTIQQAKCQLLTPGAPIPAEDPDNKKRASFACPSPTITVMVTIASLPDDQKGTDGRAFLQAVQIDGMKVSKKFDPDAHPVVELVPADASKEGERIARVLVADDWVFQVDLMRGPQPVDRAKADEVFGSFKVLK